MTRPTLFFAVLCAAALAGCAPVAIPCGAGACNDTGELCVDGRCLAAPLPTPIPTGFTEQRTITVPAGSVSDVLESFPLLVSTNDAPMSGSVAFFDDHGAPLPFDVEEYDPGNRRLLAWVRVPLLAPDAATQLVVAWGAATADAPTIKASDVWDPTYRGVWHLGDEPASPTAFDSTSRKNDGVRTIHATRAERGVFGSATPIHRSDEAIAIQSADLDFDGSVTLEAWARIDGPASNHQRLFHRGVAYQDLLEMFVEDSGATIGDASFRVDFQDTGDWQRGGVPAFAFGQWHCYAAVFDVDAGAAALYVDGAPVATATTTTTSVPTGGGKSFIGNWDAGIETAAGARNLNGVIDEVRVAARPLSPAWIAASYANAHAPDTFLILGDVESARPSP